jgi:hypothetical protein
MDPLRLAIPLARDLLRREVFSRTAGQKFSAAVKLLARFATLARERPDAFFVGPDAVLTSSCVQFAILTARCAA